MFPQKIVQIKNAQIKNGCQVGGHPYFRVVFSGYFGGGQRAALPPTLAHSPPLGCVWLCCCVYVLEIGVAYKNWKNRF
jgi:hypothetical protein